MDKKPDDNLIAIFLKGQKKTYKKGNVIFTPQDQDKYVFFIESGHVVVHGLDENHEPLFHEIYQAGRIFPIIRVFTSGPYPINAIALDNCVLYLLETEKFHELVRTDQSVSLAALDYISSLCLVYIARVRNLEEKNVYRRLVTRILHYGIRFGIRKNGYIQIDVPLTQAAIAQSIATSRESVTRNLCKLEEKGLIIYHKKHLTILDEKRLMAENLCTYDSQN